MAKFGENYRAGRDSVLCPLCKNHKDSQEESFRCTKVRDKIKVEDKYDEIFDDNHINLQRITLTKELCAQPLSLVWLMFIHKAEVEKGN